MTELLNIAAIVAQLCDLAGLNTRDVLRIEIHSTTRSEWPPHPWALTLDYVDTPTGSPRIGTDRIVTRTKTIDVVTYA